jgi:VacB/RNase II family 3'-5' exoribonuclease
MGIVTNLAKLANQVMQQSGLQPEFSVEAIEQLELIKNAAQPPFECVDLRSLLWCSIDNDDSRDLDQLSYVEKGTDGKWTVWVAIADVDALVPKDSPIDVHAKINTTSVYTPGRIFSMLPEKLSTNLTSLNEHEDRLAIVIKIWLNDTGETETSSVFQAVVHNYAKLAYRLVGGWLEGKNAIPEKVNQVAGLEALLKIHHEAAQILRKKRHESGSLTLVSSQAEVKIAEGERVLIQLPAHNFAHQIIEEFMILANRAMARTFRKENIPSLRRVVRIPKYWNRIVEIAKSFGEDLPSEPNAKALDAFLIRRRAASPDTFPDLSLAVIKLLGRGEYVVENDKEHPTGHFALALSDYTHFTAPNRRFPDLISQRQYKAFLRNEKLPYGLQELYGLADHCTQQEDAAMKVERHINKSAAAIVLSSQIGSIFKGIISGASEKGTWVRVFQPAVEGKIIRGFQGLSIGDKVSVRLEHVDISRGFIDFSIAH